MDEAFRARRRRERVTLTLSLCASARVCVSHPSVRVTADPRTVTMETLQRNTLNFNKALLTVLFIQHPLSYTFMDQEESKSSPPASERPVCSEGLLPRATDPPTSSKSKGTGESRGVLSQQRVTQRGNLWDSVWGENKNTGGTRKGPSSFGWKPGEDPWHWVTELHTLSTRAGCRRRQQWHSRTERVAEERKRGAGNPPSQIPASIEAVVKSGGKRGWAGLRCSASNRFEPQFLLENINNKSCGCQMTIQLKLIELLRNIFI